jgi:hypothetical protein
MAAPATQIICTGFSQTAGSGLETLTVVLWYTITSGMKAVSGTSAWSGASSAENAAIQAGTVFEEVVSFQFPIGIAFSLIQTFLLQYWSNRNAIINGIGPGQYYGAGYSNGTWVGQAT